MSKNYFDNYYDATATRKKFLKSEKKKKKIKKIAAKRYYLPSSFYHFKVALLKYAK